MANFETTIEFEERILKPLSERKFPAQVIWGKHDSELSVDTFGLDVKMHLILKLKFIRWKQNTFYRRIAQRRLLKG